MYMIGGTKETSEPTIMFCGRDSKCRKQVKKTVKESGILQKHPGVRLGDASRPPDFDKLVKLGGVSYQDLSSGAVASEPHDPNNSLGANLYLNRLVFGEESGSWFGKKLFIPFHDSNQNLISVRVATGGGILPVGDRYFYLTAGHIFENGQRLSNADVLAEVDDFAFDLSEGEESDNENDIVDTTSRGSITPDIAESTSSDDTSTSSNTHPDSSKLVQASEPISNMRVDRAPISIPDSDTLEQPFDGLMLVGGLLKETLHEFCQADLDYSLIEICTTFRSYIESSDILAPSFYLSGGLVMEPADKQVSSVTASAGLIKGTMSGTPTYQLVAGARNAKELWTIRLEGTLSDGDCGSWVVDQESGDLVGHIVAGSPKSGVAYVVPAFNVLKDAKKKYDLDLELSTFPNPHWKPREPHSSIEDISTQPRESSPVPSSSKEKAGKEASMLSLRPINDDGSLPSSIASDFHWDINVRWDDPDSTLTSFQSVVCTMKIDLNGGWANWVSESIVWRLGASIRPVKSAVNDFGFNGQPMRTSGMTSLAFQCIKGRQMYRAVFLVASGYDIPFDMVLGATDSARIGLLARPREPSDTSVFLARSSDSVSHQASTFLGVPDNAPNASQKAAGKQNVTAPNILGATNSAMLGISEAAGRTASRKEGMGHQVFLGLAMPKRTEVEKEREREEEQQLRRQDVLVRREKSLRLKEDKTKMKEAFEPSATSANPIASPNDVEKSPIKFKDAVGRKFSFPFHLCKKWEDMEELIKHAFLHVDAIGPDVQEGCYDLIGPDGEIILRQDWETRLEPGWSITMRMWSTAESVSTAPKPSSLLGGASTSKPTQPRAPRQPKPTQPRAPGQSKPNSRLRHILKQMQEYTGPDKGV